MQKGREYYRLSLYVTMSSQYAWHGVCHNDRMKYRVQFLATFLRVHNMNTGLADIENAIAKYDRGDVLQLQDFIGDWLKPEWQWLTRIGLIDAMDALYKDAINNANIHEA